MRLLKYFSLCILFPGCLSPALIASDISSLGPFGGDVRSLTVHPAAPQHFFLGTSDGQIYLSENGGDLWQKLTPGVGLRDVVIDNLVFDPNDPQVLYAGCWNTKSSQGWLFKTSDGGQSWQHLPTGSFTSQIRAIAIAPSDPRVMALGVSEGVLLSADGGASWDRISRGYRSLYNVESMAFDAKDSQTLYVGTWRLGWKTTDRGKKWQAIHEGMIFDSDMFSLLVNPQNPEILFASACTGVYRSVNAGSSWSKLTNGLPKEAKRTRTLHMDPADPNTIYAGTTIGLFVSSDGGTSWSKLFSDVVVNTIAVHPADHRVVLVGTDDAGVLKTQDGGKTFSASNQGFIHRQISALAVDPRDSRRLYAGVSLDGPYGGLFVSYDDGTRWEPLNEGLDSRSGSITTILPASQSNQVFIGTGQGLFSGYPKSEQWQRIRGTEKFQILDLAFADDEERLLLLATSVGILRLKLDSQKIDKLIIPVYEGRIHSLLRDTSTQYLFATTDTGIFRSDDSGKSWTIKVSGLPPMAVNVIEKTGNRLLAGTPNGLYYSDNDGDKWAKMQDVFPLNIAAIKANPDNPDQVFAADTIGGYLFRSQDGGKSWESVAPESRSRISRLVFASADRLLAGSLSEGVYLLTVAPRSTAGGK